MTKIINEATEEKQAGTSKNAPTGGNYLNDPEVAVKLNHILHRNIDGQVSICYYVKSKQIGFL